MAMTKTRAMNGETIFRPASFHASTPPSSALTFSKPFSRYFSAARADDSSFGHCQ